MGLLCAHYLGPALGVVQLAKWWLIAGRSVKTHQAAQHPDFYYCVVFLMRNASVSEPGTSSLITLVPVEVKAEEEEVQYNGPPKSPVTGQKAQCFSPVSSYWSSRKAK